MGRFKTIVKNPLLIYSWASVKGLTKMVPDRIHLKLRFKAHLGYNLNLAAPITFNEKIQWLKIYDRNPEYTKLVDKLRVKQWVIERIGSEYVARVLGVWDSADDISTELLPDRRR